jgi:hypothetical protein
LDAANFVIASEAKQSRTASEGIPLLPPARSGASADFDPAKLA